MIALADMYANGYGLEPYPYNAVYEPELAELLEKVGVDGDSLCNMRETALQDMEKAKIFLQVARKGQ